MAQARALSQSNAGYSTGLTDTEIHDRIIASILDHRLLPGTKLVEDKLGQAFGVSRTRVRQVLIRLSGKFHLRIAQWSGHQTLARILRELVTRTSTLSSVRSISTPLPSRQLAWLNCSG